MLEALRELMADEINEIEKRSEKRGERKGLEALIDVLKSMHMDFESAYQSIIKTEAYANVSKEQVLEFWK